MDQEDRVKPVLADKGIDVSNDELLLKVIALVKDRCTLLPDFYTQSSYFFTEPKEYDLNAVKPKWTDAKTEFFKALKEKYQRASNWEPAELETTFKELTTEKGFKIGDVMLPFRIMLVGGKFGPHVFDIGELLGKEETLNRIDKALAAFTA
jgi:glutamyl-tRNA synthetase